MGIAPEVLINDRYELVERIAVGSTGQVWRATDLVLARQVAVKILHPERLEDQAFRERFRAEARHAAQLSHPGVAEVHDFGEYQDVAFLVMEYLPGQSLATMLDRRRTAAGGRDGERGPGLGTEATLEIVAQVARALQAAHDIGLIHRDIKPANLIVGRDGEVTITDFGTARALNASTVTEPGVVVGTAEYLSPEQAEGRPLTPATDVYSLGVVAYTCLTGQPPFSGASPVEIAAGHVHDRPRPLPDTIPRPVRELVEACLAKSPEGRPSSAAELAGQCVASRAALPRMTTVPAAPVARRRPVPLGAAAAGAVLAVGGMLLLGSGTGPLTSTPIVDDQRIDTPADSRDHPRPVPGPARADTSGDKQRPDRPTPPVAAGSAGPTVQGTQPPPHSLPSGGRTIRSEESPSTRSDPTVTSAPPGPSTPVSSSPATPPEQPSAEQTPTSSPRRSDEWVPTGTPTAPPSTTAPGDSPGGLLVPRSPSTESPTQTSDPSTERSEPAAERSGPTGSAEPSGKPPDTGAPSGSGDPGTASPSESEPEPSSSSPGVLSPLAQLLGTD